MESLFNPQDNQKILSRIHSLTAASRAQWGTMSVEQMVAHCRQPLLVAFGELKLKRGLMAVLFGGMFRKKLTKDETPFGKNIPTDPNFRIVKTEALEEEKAKLAALVQRLAAAGPEGLTREAHPFFGKMTGKEWDIIQWKHLDHHLRQFGA